MEILTTIPALFLDVKRYQRNIWPVLILYFTGVYLLALTKNMVVIFSSLILGVIIVWILSEKFYKWFSKSGFIYLTADEIIIEILNKETKDVEIHDNFKWSSISRIVANNTYNKVTARLRLYFWDGTMVRYSFANQFYSFEHASVGTDIPKFVKEYNKGKEEGSIIKLGLPYFN